MSLCNNTHKYNIQLKVSLFCSGKLNWLLVGNHPATTKHLYNPNTMLNQRRGLALHKCYTKLMFCFSCVGIYLIRLKCRYPISLYQIILLYLIMQYICLIAHSWPTPPIYGIFDKFQNNLQSK